LQQSRIRIPIKGNECRSSGNVEVGAPDLRKCCCLLVSSKARPISKMSDASVLPEKMENPPYSEETKAGVVGWTDVERDSGDVEVVHDKKLERRLLWKFDIYLLPALAVMYLFK
jgi:hypothetical protein